MTKKTKKQMGVLGGLLAIVIVVIIINRPGGKKAFVSIYQTKKVDTNIDTSIFEMDEFKKLSNPIELPITFGETGRENPFEPF